MREKIRALLGSIRFWQITGAAVSAYLAVLATNGYSAHDLLLAISAWLGVIAGVGTIDKVNS